MTQGGRVRLALLDHISSPSALLFPIGKAVLMLRRFFIVIRDHQNQNSIISIFIIIDIGFRHGVEVLVDGAHAPGQIELSLELLDADYYTGQWSYLMMQMVRMMINDD